VPLCRPARRPASTPRFTAVAYARIHPLSAGRTVGCARRRRAGTRAPARNRESHAVVHVITSKPVHLHDIHFRCSIPHGPSHHQTSAHDDPSPSPVAQSASRTRPDPLRGKTSSSSASSRSMCNSSFVAGRSLRHRQRKQLLVRSAGKARCPAIGATIDLARRSPPERASQISWAPSGPAEPLAHRCHVPRNGPVVFGAERSRPGHPIARSAIARGRPEENTAAKG